MAQGQFIVSDTNPNNETGGGGCVCDERQQTDCKPPFIVLYQNSMDSGISPHVVACQRCIREWAAALEGESLSLGDPHDAETVNPDGADPYETAKLIQARHRGTTTPYIPEDSTPPRSEDEAPEI